MNTGITNVKFICIEKDKCLYPPSDCSKCPKIINLSDYLNTLGNDLGKDFIIEIKEDEVI